MVFDNSTASPESLLDFIDQKPPLQREHVAGSSQNKLYLEDKTMGRDVCAFCKKEILPPSRALRSRTSGIVLCEDCVSKAVERTVNSGTSVAMSVNEYGQTAAGIVGTKRSNLYDGQDLENGIRFSIKASKALNNGLKLPTKMFHAAEKLVGAGAIAGMMVLTPLREVKPERENMMPSKTKEFGKNLPDISDQER